MTTNDAPRTLLLEGTDGHLLLRVLSREDADPADRYWDANWLVTDVEVRERGFSARLQASLKAEELTDLLVELRRLASGEATVARLRSIEGWLALDLTEEDDGVTVAGRAREPADPTTELRFVIRGVRRSDVTEIGDRLARILAGYPVLGRRDQ
ncbi:MAG: hypothetical protein ACNA8R_01730 [Nitriliruptoraceae bacterium]